MFSTAVIIFREVLEAALIIGIVAAATRTVPGRNYWLTAGVLSGLLGAGIVAFFASNIADRAGGMGQELFNAIVLGLAVVMLAWHNIWMSSHGAELAKNARSVGVAISDGRSECSVLLVIVGLAVLREGSEATLFLYGIAASEGAGAIPMLTGGLAGLLVGVVVGYALYAGLLRVPMRWFFAATGMLILFLAAGMASRSAHFLIQADLLPSLAAPVWDTSALLSQQSMFGTLLHILVGYEDKPAGMQLIFYVSALIVISLGMKWAGRPRNVDKKMVSA